MEKEKNNDMLDLSYITFCRNSAKTKVYGYTIQIRPPLKYIDSLKLPTISKVFLESKYENALMAAMDFRDNDPDCQKLIKLKNEAETKLRGKRVRKVTETEEEATAYVQKRFNSIMKRYNFTKFPVVLNNGLKLIGLDMVNGKNVFFIKECKTCHAHKNILPARLKEDSGNCKQCAAHETNTYFQVREKGNLFYCKGSIKTHINGISSDILKVDISFTKRFEHLKEQYQIYFRYIFDMIIKKFGLKYKRNYTDIELKDIEKQIKSFDIPEPRIYINLDFIENDASIRKQTHVFKANLAGFGSHKYDPSLKMVLLNKVEYVGIDNFRDHMWTPFSTELDLPPGTQIKFKGEIYDYEKGYQGKNPDGKISQAIKIIKMLEVIPPINNN